MSVRAGAWATLVQAGDPGAKLVLLILAEWWMPGESQRADLAKLAWRSEMTVVRTAATLARLKTRGLLTTLEIDGDHGAFTYALPTPETMDAAIDALS